MRKRRLFVICTLAILVFTFVTFGVQVYKMWTLPEVVTYAPVVTGNVASQGQVSFCVNNPPSIEVPCNASLTQNTSYYCALNLSDQDGDTPTVTRSFVSGGASIFNVSSDGIINFTPTNDDVGNYTVNFTVDDGTGCINSENSTLFSFSVANINDPPFLEQNIPDQSFQSNTTLSAFFLTDYFTDPDGDNLTFTSTIPPGISVTILSSSEVRFSSNSCIPNGELVIFTATDPSNAYAESNPVRVNVTCEATPTDGGSASDDSSGGGGGGGGGGCIPTWECQEWFSCLPSNEQWRRCYDLAACVSDKYVTRVCEYVGPPPVCEENWLCGEWGQCLLNNTQYRECEDLAECGSRIVRPETEQGCVYLPTCNDGVQNGDETGVDCGGECAACVITEQPSSIVSEFAYWWLVFLILGVLISAGVLRYYQSAIAKSIARAGFMFRRETFKDILLNKEQRNRMFEQILQFEQRHPSMEPDEVYDSLGLLVRQYVLEALGVQVESLLEEVDREGRRMRLQPVTREMIHGLFEKLDVIEQEELVYDEYFVQYTLEELRTLVCLTSEYEQPEIERAIEELVPDEEMSFYDEIFVRMINTLRAVQFGQYDIAQKEYVKLLEVYEPLEEGERDQVYPELQWVFSTIKFASNVTGERIIKKGEA